VVASLDQTVATPSCLVRMMLLSPSVMLAALQMVVLHICRSVVVVHNMMLPSALLVVEVLLLLPFDYSGSNPL